MAKINVEQIAKSEFRIRIPTTTKTNPKPKPKPKLKPKPNNEIKELGRSIPLFREHDVVVVPVANPNDISRHAAAGTGAREGVDGALRRLRRRIGVTDPLLDRILAERLK
jgi:hypothetical protein